MNISSIYKRWFWSAECRENKGEWSIGVLGTGVLEYWSIGVFEGLEDGSTGVLQWWSNAVVKVSGFSVKVSASVFLFPDT